MATPVVDTFEHDIADEIRQKEASIADIASADGDIGNKSKEQTSPSGSGVIFGVVIVLVLCAIVGIIAMGYLYYTGKYDPFAVPQATMDVVKKDPSKTPVAFSSLFPTLKEAFGIYVTNVERSQAGYNVTITSYSPVFSYMIKNEQVYKEELGIALNPPSKTKNVVTTPTEPPTITGTTTNETSATGTSIQVAPTETSSTTNDVVPSPLDSIIFSDVTIDNQNMRVGNTLSGTVVYAFVGTDHLIFSSSTNGILLLRNNILHK